MNNWKELPNAKYISCVIESYKRNKSLWVEYWEAGVNPEWDVVNKIARYEIERQGRTEIFSSLYDWKKNHTLLDVFSALIAWDDCGYMLDSDPSEIELLAKLGDQKAFLLYYACKVLSIDK